MRRVLENLPRRPFLDEPTRVHHRDSVGDGGGDLIRMLLEEPPVPIQNRRPEVPTALARVLDKGLTRDPADRFQTATELRRALRPFC